jgi:hypothetical protein
LILISLGLNACWGRLADNKPVDFTNMKLLLQYLASLDPNIISPLKGFEFGII